jgi:xanthine/uracil permease
MKKRITTALRFLGNSKAEFAKLKNKSLEEVLENYIKLVLLSAVVAAIFSFIRSLVYAVYLNIFEGVTINFMNLANYSASLSGGIFFFYLFVGTIFSGILTMLLNIFLRKKYTELVKIYCMSLIPVLLFGWISQSIGLCLLIWSAYLFILGLRK